jgi:hypothetical protein
MEISFYILLTISTADTFALQAQEDRLWGLSIKGIFQNPCRLQFGALERGHLLGIIL